MRRRPHELLGLLIAPLALLTACGGSGGPPPAGEAAGGDPDLPTTAQAASVAGHPENYAPLLGLEVEGEALERIHGPAVVVKIDNDPSARPQSGLNQADLVYEVEVEGVTRFAAVFHAADATRAGPVRSARSSDVDIVGNLGRPLVAWSGANPTVASQMAEAERWGVLVNLSHDDHGDLFWRDAAGTAPHNLYSDTSALRQQADSTAKPPNPVFSYRAAGDDLPEGAVPAYGVSIGYRGDGRISAVEYVWDGSRGGWRRYQTDFRHGEGSAAHRDSDGTQIAPENVVLMFVRYTESAAGGGSPQAITVGEGEAIVLTDGHAIPARWSRPEAASAIALETSGGEPVMLSPGRTWIALPLAGTSQFLTPDRAEALLSSN